MTTGTLREIHYHDGRQWHRMPAPTIPGRENLYVYAGRSPRTIYRGLALRSDDLPFDWTQATGEQLLDHLGSWLPKMHFKDDKPRLGPHWTDRRSLAEEATIRSGHDLRLILTGEPSGEGINQAETETARKRFPKENEWNLDYGAPVNITGVEISPVGAYPKWRNILQKPSLRSARSALLDDPQWVKTVADAIKGGGFTLDQEGHQPDSGYSVSTHPDRERIFDMDEIDPEDVAEFQDDNADLFEGHPENNVGGWANQKNHKFYLDVPQRFPRGWDAVNTALDNDELAIYDLGHHWELPTEDDGAYNPLLDSHFAKRQRASDLLM